MSKKNVELIEQYRNVFLEGCKKSGLKKEVAESIFENIKSFGEYGFNKSHAAAYGILVYRTAYLKANYPLEYFTALLSSEIGHSAVSKDAENKIVGYINDAREFGIEILPPDINKSYSRFTIEQIPGDNASSAAVGSFGIRFGLLAVKNVGEGAVESIVTEREKSGQFTSIDNFASNIDSHAVNKKVLESLCKAGAFDKLLPTKRQQPVRDVFCENIEKIMPKNGSPRNDKNQTMLFDMGTASSGVRRFDVMLEELPREKQWHEHQLLAFEKEVLGFYLSGHPLAKYSSEMKIYAKMSIAEIKKSRSQSVRVAGIIANLRKSISKKKELYARFKLEDMEDEIDVLVFPKLYNDMGGDSLKMDEMVVVSGRLNMESEPPEIIADEIVPFKKARVRLVRKIVIGLKAVGLEKNTLEELKALLKKHPGGARVEFALAGHKNKMRIVTDFEIEPSEAVISGAENILGRNVISLE